LARLNFSEFDSHHFDLSIRDKNKSQIIRGITQIEDGGERRVRKFPGNVSNSIKSATAIMHAGNESSEDKAAKRLSRSDGDWVDTIEIETIGREATAAMLSMFLDQSKLLTSSATRHLTLVGFSSGFK
jgi:hypothetical protein